MRNHTLAEIRERRPTFFKNAEGPEGYRVRKNHLITKRLDNGKIRVWQLVRNEGIYRLRPVWYPPNELSLNTVIWDVESRLDSGQWPLSIEINVNPYTGEAYNETNEN